MTKTVTVTPRELLKDYKANYKTAGHEEAFRKLVAELGIQAKQLIHPVRVALTGKTVGPGLFEVIYYLGRERSVRRLLKWVK